jgi:hypothetical protein
MDWFKQNKTLHYLYYFTDINKITDKQFQKMINELETFNYICKNIGEKPVNVLKIDSVDERKEFLIQKIKENILPEFQNQLIGKLPNIQFFTAEEVKNENEAPAESLLDRGKEVKY